MFYRIDIVKNTRIPMEFLIILVTGLLWTLIESKKILIFTISLKQKYMI